MRGSGGDGFSDGRRQARGPYFHLQQSVLASSLKLVQQTVGILLRRLGEYTSANASHLIWLIGAPGGTRTPGLLVRSQPLYPTELRARL